MSRQACSSVEQKDRASSSRSRGTPRTPAAVLMVTGKNANMATITTLAKNPKPNATTRIGMTATSGVANSAEM
ncbi:hypothetical protein BCA37_25690 [Mycobacterium sp. djl-10]|nr:hypothetical protein BCA37_25690 [Mycobacterium sp. djl-10]